MAQVLKVQQVPPSPNLNGHSTSEKNGNGMSIDEESSSQGLTHIQNGNLFHGTPTKDQNGASTSMMEADDLQLSPGDLRRRSTRASALKAQEKIKLKDDIVQGPQKRLNEDEEEGEEGQMQGESGPESAPKKRRLEDGRQFDQTCFRFGLRANDEGEVYAMTDESENSSLHESEMEVVRFHYEKMKNREPDAEQLKERLKMRREAEQSLRDEEAKLHVLKRMKESQGRAINKLAAETKQLDLEETAKAAAAAYKPVLANHKLSANGRTIAQQNATKTMAGLANLSQQQQLDLLAKLSSQSPAAKQAYLMAKKNPSQTTALFAQLINMNTQQIQKQKEAQEAHAAATAAAAAAASSSSANVQVQSLGHQAQSSQSVQQNVQITQKQLLNQQTPAQRIAAARVSFRAQADKQLMTIPTQKQQPHDINFLPNPNASAFPALLGLDLTVQVVLKDRSFEKRYPGPYYECEECGIDWSHTWKCMGTAPDDLHLYCEACVRTAQKKKNRMEQTALLKRAFQKISAQEKEFEKRISEGQLEQLAEAKAAAAAASVATPTQIPTSSTATVSSTPLGPRINMPSSSGTSTPTQATKSSTPLPPTPKSATSGASASAKKMTTQQQQAAAAAMMSQMMSNQIMKNPMMQQMMQAYLAQQMAAATTAGGRGNMANGMNAAAVAAAAAATNPMALFMAQAQAAMVQQAQQAQVQAAAQQAQREAAAQREAQREAREAQAKAKAQEQQQSAQSQQNAMLLALFGSSNGMTQQQIQQIRALTPAQQRALLEAVKAQQNQQKK